MDHTGCGIACFGKTSHLLPDAKFIVSPPLFWIAEKPAERKGET